MQDKLKQYVASSPEDFEEYSFDIESGWEDLSKKLSNKKKRNRKWIWGIAACLALALLSSVLIINVDNEEVSELAEVEQFYQDEIDRKISLVKDYIDNDPILEDLAAMDKAFAELRSDLSDNVDNEEVIMAMMENYRLKLKILEEILIELEKKENENSI